MIDLMSLIGAFRTWAIKLTMSARREIVLQNSKMPWDQFPGNRPNKPQSPNDVASRPLPESPVSSSLDNVVPQMIV